jgi:hypothetical protein
MVDAPLRKALHGEQRPFSMMTLAYQLPFYTLLTLWLVCLHTDTHEGLTRFSASVGPHRHEGLTRFPASVGASYGQVQENLVRLLVESL